VPPGERRHGLKATPEIFDAATGRTAVVLGPAN
jgi:hypothetical protein